MRPILAPLPVLPLLALGWGLATPALADPAQALLDEMREICAENGETLIGPDQVWLPLDLGPDAPGAQVFASPDWGCSATPGLFWHTGGGEVMFRVEGEVYQATARGWTVIEVWDLPVILLSRHGSFCMGAGYQPCFEALVWSDGRWQTMAGHPPFEAD